MTSYGFRPEIKDKHLTVVRFASSVLGDEFRRLINDYDFMRKKRNRFIYEPDIPCSIKEARDALKTAEEFVNKVSKLIKVLVTIILQKAGFILSSEILFILEKLNTLASYIKGCISQSYQRKFLI